MLCEIGIGTVKIGASLSKPRKCGHNNGRKSILQGRPKSTVGQSEGSQRMNEALTVRLGRWETCILHLGKKETMRRLVALEMLISS